MSRPRLYFRHPIFALSIFTTRPRPPSFFTILIDPEYIDL